MRMMSLSMMHLPGSKRVFIQQQIAAHDCAMSTISNLVQAPIRVKGPTVMVQPKAACSLQLAQKAAESCARMEESARQCVSHLDAARRAVKGKMPAVNFSHDRVDEWMHSARRALRSSMPAAGLSSATMTKWMQKASKAGPMPPLLSEVKMIPPMVACCVLTQ